MRLVQYGRTCPFFNRINALSNLFAVSLFLLLSGSLHYRADNMRMIHCKIYHMHNRIMPGEKKREEKYLCV